MLRWSIWGKWEVVGNSRGVSEIFKDYEVKSSKILVTHICKYTKNYRVTHFKYLVQLLDCKSYSVAFRQVPTLD
jgi:hypothetical protein